MIRIQHAAVVLTVTAAGVGLAPAAHAQYNVTYEVVSDDINTVNIEYYDHSRRKALDKVPLPWRTDVTVVDARSPSDDGAEVRADWRPLAKPSKWVTVRIYIRGTMVCENRIDVGNATCYGSTPFTS